MLTEEIIKRKKELIKREIIQDVISGMYSDFSLHEHKCWIDALDYVLEVRTEYDE